MYDFPENTDLQAIISAYYEAGKIVSAVCHGVGGLLNVRLSNGKNLIADKKLHDLVGWKNFLQDEKIFVPFSLEKRLKEQGAQYSKAFFPMSSKVMIDENLITGHNTFSLKAIARAVIGALKK